MTYLATPTDAVGGESELLLNFGVRPISCLRCKVLSITESKNSNLISSPILCRLSEYAKNGRSRNYIAKIDECEVGFLCYDDWSDQGSGFIYEMFVLPEYRGEGVGQSLVLYSEELAKSLSCNFIRLEPRAFDYTVNLSWLVSWYQRRGYSPMPNDPNKMEKVLVAT